jgi:hypothetical protein
MSRNDSHELTVALAALVRAYADSTALVMRALNIDLIDAERIVHTIRFGIIDCRMSCAYTHAAIDLCVNLGVDWEALLAVVSKGEGTAGAQAGAQGNEPQ